MQKAAAERGKYRSGKATGLVPVMAAFWIRAFWCLAGAYVTTSVFIEGTCIYFAPRVASTLDPKSVSVLVVIVLSGTWWWLITLVACAVLGLFFRLIGPTIVNDWRLRVSIAIPLLGLVITQAVFAVRFGPELCRLDL